MLDFIYRKSSLITDNAIKQESKILQNYVGHLNEVFAEKNYESDESSLRVPGDPENYKQVKTLSDELNSDVLKYIFVIGIGGSNLGTQAVYHSLFGVNDVYDETRYPKIVFVDNISPSGLLLLKNIIQKQVKHSEEILVNVVCKSGGTHEPLVNFELILPMLLEKFGANIRKRIVITAGVSSPLAKLANAKQYTVLSMPDKVGGRYSVFTAVGLFPLMQCGIDIRGLLRGAQKMCQLCLSEDVKKNPALLSAIITREHYNKGCCINNTFLFDQDLESLGKWYRQLLGESIGKEYDLNGKEVRAGMMPIISIGSRDLHSVLQLLLGGPKNIFTTFVHHLEPSVKMTVPAKMEFPSLIQHIEKKSVKLIPMAIYHGVKIAYSKRNLPFIEIIMDEISEENIGAFMQFKMIEMMYLAQLFNVNAFDQPNVEEYKVETKKYLKNNY